MSNYRDLNKELVEQVQTMRKNMKLYCDEIVFLKGELMERYESEVILRKQCYSWAVNNFLQIIQIVQPDSDILTIIKEHIHSQENTLSSSARSRASLRSRTSGDRYLNGQRRSSLLTELRRSNSVLNIRTTLCSTSPIRRSNGDMMDEQNSQSFQEATEVEENAEAVENEQAQTETLPQLKQNRIENVIYEEFEEEEERDLDVDSVNESVEEVSVDISPAKSTLTEEKSYTKTVGKRKPTKKANTKNYSDQEYTPDEHESSMELENDANVNALSEEKSYTKTVSKRGRPKKNFSDQENTTDDHESSMDIETDASITALRKEKSYTKTVNKRGRPKIANTKKNSDQENTPDEHESLMDLEKDANVNALREEKSYTKTLNKRGRAKIAFTKNFSDQENKSDEQEISMELETLQELRRHTNARRVSETNNSFLISQVINRLGDETVKSPSSVLTDITLRNFKDAAACSTPNSCQNTLIKPKTPSFSNEPPPDVLVLTALGVSATTSARPSRQCKPKDLAEPKMNTKMRCEMDFPRKRNTKKKK